MKEFIANLEKSYQLKIGDRELSPINKASLGIVLNYVSEVRKNGLRQPLIISYPAKKETSLYLAAGILMQFFMEDYDNQIESRFEQLNLKDGDRITIFGEPTKWHKDNRIEITELVPSEFGRERKVSLHPIPNSYLPYINRDSSRTSRIISKEILNRRLNELRINRKAIDRILGAEEKYGINTAILDSKMVLISGRGNMSVFQNTLKDLRIYNEPMSEIFSVGNNLLLEQSLEEYNSIFNGSDNEDSEFYRELFTQASQSYKGSSGRSLLKELIQAVNDNMFRTSVFVEKYNQFLQELEESEKDMFFNLNDYHPGITEDLPSNLKAVIINDIRQFDSFHTTVEKFISRGIPVIILTDRQFDFIRPLEFSSNIFNSEKKYLTLNWNKEKILELIPLGNPHAGYFDQEIWRTAVCYARQKLSMRVFSAGEIEDVFFSLPGEISSLQGFEQLKQAFWRYMYPAGFIIKNTSGRLMSIQVPVKKFSEVFEPVKLLLGERTRLLIDKAIDLYTKFIYNPKSWNAEKPLYTQKIGIGDIHYEIPHSNHEFRKVRRIKEGMEALCFPGFPYNEKSNRLLADAVSRYFVSDLTLLVWNKECATTKNYLKKILLAGYFLDNLDISLGFPQHLLLADSEKVNAEVDSYLPLCSSSFAPDEESKLNSFFDTVSYLRHSKYALHADNNNGFSVKCNIIHLDRSEFIYLPYTSKILARTELASGETGLKQSVFEELSVGQTVYQYHTKRSDLRSFARADESLEQAFKDLEIWKRCLLDAYSLANNHTGHLESYLTSQKQNYGLSGNPSRGNIQRWLFDDDLISPEEDNLRIILHGGCCMNIDNAVEKTIKAAGLVKSFSISISAQIKRLIAGRVGKKGQNNDHEFTISIEGISVKVSSRTIEGLERNDVLIDYSYTRKIIS